MALANIKRQLRGARTRLNNIANELQANDYALPDPPTTPSLCALLARLMADGAKIQRALDTLDTWRQNYVDHIEGVHEDEFNDAQAEFLTFLGNEQIDQARDRMDIIAAKRIEIENLLAVQAPPVPRAPALAAGVGHDAKDEEFIKIRYPTGKITKFYGNYAK